MSVMMNTATASDGPMSTSHGRRAGDVSSTAGCPDPSARAVPSTSA